MVVDDRCSYDVMMSKLFRIKLPSLCSGFDVDVYFSVCTAPHRLLGGFALSFIEFLVEANHQSGPIFV